MRREIPSLILLNSQPLRVPANHSCKERSRGPELQSWVQPGPARKSGGPDSEPLGFLKSRINQDFGWGTLKVPLCFDPSKTIILASCDVFLYALTSFVVQMRHMFISRHFYSTHKLSCEYYLTRLTR